MDNKKIAIVTGATSGIGLATSRGLLTAGWRVVGVGRDSFRGRHMVEILRAQTGNPAVSFVQADLSSVEDSRRLGEELLKAHPRIDLLINNAGAMYRKRQETAEGAERTFALNYLGPFVLTQALWPALGSARVVNVASGMHHRAELRLDDLEMEARPYNGMLQYSNTKLMNILFTRSLAKRLPDTAMPVALHPGFVATRFGNDNGFLWRLAMRVMQLTAISPAQSAKGVLRAALEPVLVRGSYFDQGEIAEPSEAARNDELAESLWVATEKLLQS